MYQETQKSNKENVMALQLETTQPKSTKQQENGGFFFFAKASKECKNRSTVFLIVVE